MSNGTIEFPEKENPAEAGFFNCVRSFQKP